MTQMVVPFNDTHMQSGTSRSHEILPINPEIRHRPKETGQNPISQLQELCQENAWPMPIYNLVKEDGPPHMKRFLFEVKVNYTTYKTLEIGQERRKKQDAKAEAARYALKRLLN